VQNLKTLLVNRLKTLLDESNTISRETSRIEKLLVHLDSGAGVKLSDITNSIIVKKMNSN